MATPWCWQLLAAEVPLQATIDLGGPFKLASQQTLLGPIETVAITAQAIQQPLAQLAERHRQGGCARAQPGGRGPAAPRAAGGLGELGGLGVPL